VDIQLKSVTLSSIQKSNLFRGLYERGCSTTLNSPPLHVGWHSVCRTILERTVSNQLCIKASIGSMVDVLKEDTIMRRADLGASLVSINMNKNLSTGNHCCQPPG